MSGPVMYLGMWDSGRDSHTLLSAACEHFQRMGTALDRGDDAALAFLHPPFPPSSEPARVEALTPNTGAGGLIQVSFSIAEIDDDEYDWSPFEAEVMSLTQGVRPTLLTISTEWTAGALPDPPWSHAYFLFSSGWVNLESCTSVQRTEFATLRDESLASWSGVGIRWPAENTVDSEHDPIGRDELTARAYHAWTGRIAPPPKANTVPAPSAEDLAPRALWFWSHQTPAESLLTRVEAVAGPRGLSSQTWDFGQEECWRFVMSLYEPQGRSLEKLLDDLRCALPVVQPSWAGLQPQSGFLMPGPETDVPAVSIITHPWVSRDWIGEELPGLEEVLAGCHREEIAGGVLWITDPDLAPTSRFGEDWYDRHLRFERMASAAEILGRAARRSVGRTS